MFDDPWAEEPEDPYADLGDPEARFGLTIPDDADVSRELWRAFWSLVAVFNVGLFATALGALLLVFRGELIVGGACLAVGLLSLAYGLHRYRVYRAAGVAAEPEDGP